MSGSRRAKRSGARGRRSGRTPLAPLVLALGLAVAIAAAGATGCAVHSASEPAMLAGGPHAVVREPVRDFGTVEPGTPVAQRFEVANAGDLPLDIVLLSAPCRCSATMITDPSIAPGRIGAVEVALDTTKLSGRQAKVVRLKTNDPQVAELELTLHGEVAADLRVEPARVFLGHIGRGDVAAGVVSVIVLRPEIAITSITSESGQLEVSHAPLDEPLQGVRLLVVPRTNGSLGRFSDSIVVSTTSPRQPRIEIPVLVSVEERSSRSASAGGASSGAP